MHQYSSKLIWCPIPKSYMSSNIKKLSFIPTLIWAFYHLRPFGGNVFVHCHGYNQSQKVSSQNTTFWQKQLFKFFKKYFCTQKLITKYIYSHFLLKLDTMVVTCAVFEHPPEISYSTFCCPYYTNKQGSITIFYVMH